MDNFRFCGGVCILFLIVFVGMLITTAIVNHTENNITDNTQVAEETKSVYDSLVNATNKTFNPTKITFVYYDMNTTNWKGCYGLNYTLLTDEDNNKFLLDHAQTDILGNATDYTFRYPEGISILYENSTETEQYNQTGYYYVHELRSDNGTVIKSAQDNTFNDKNHIADFIPSGWVYEYTNEDKSGTYLTSAYKGDILLKGAYTNNTIGPERDVFFPAKYVIGLMCYANGDMSFYKYGFDKDSLRMDSEGHVGYGGSGSYIYLSNGTHVTAFDIETRDLTDKQKSDITNYDERIKEIRGEQANKDILKAIDEADYDQQKAIINSRPKSSRGYYYSPSGGHGYSYSQYYYD
ncbi:MAG: hypothetical protein E7Z84_02870 [Methanosphaera stadtmanae]|nr:hypothetical protein [Methanosphaera stadtmanae]